MIKLKIQFLNEKERRRLIECISQSFTIIEKSQVLLPKYESELMIQHLICVLKETK